MKWEFCLCIVGTRSYWTDSYIFPFFFSSLFGSQDSSSLKRVRRRKYFENLLEEALEYSKRGLAHFCVLLNPCCT